MGTACPHRGRSGQGEDGQAGERRVSPRPQEPAPGEGLRPEEVVGQGERVGDGVLDRALHPFLRIQPPEAEHVGGDQGAGQQRSHHREDDRAGTDEGAEAPGGHGQAQQRANQSGRDPTALISGERRRIR